MPSSVRSSPPLHSQGAILSVPQYRGLVCERIDSINAESPRGNGLGWISTMISISSCSCRQKMISLVVFIIEAHGLYVYSELLLGGK